MDLFLTLAFLFFIGSVIGWVLELFFRRFFSPAKREKKWINPGFCTGPYLPIYGFGLCILYLIASLEDKTAFVIENGILNKALLFLFMAFCMTLIEYIAGILAIKIVKVRLWDYRNEWGNIQGIICPKFSFFWAVLGATYYFLIHPYILDSLAWLSDNLAFSFFIGLFFGIFIIDAARSVRLVSKIKKFAEENDIIVRYEALKAHIRSKSDKARSKYRFFDPFGSDKPLHEHLREFVKARKTKHKDKSDR